MSKIFSGKSREKILRLFLEKEAGSMYIREISRQLGTQIFAIRRELMILEEAGVLEKEISFKKHFYSLGNSAKSKRIQEAIKVLLKELKK